MRTEKVKWNERMIGQALARQVFARKYLVTVPNCTWTGDEIDLLVVTPDLHLIDVEVKITRADLRADARKYKWQIPLSYTEHMHRRMCKIQGQPLAERQRLEWPRCIWKHYYAFPRELWASEIADHLKKTTPKSGVILMTANNEGRVYAQIERRSQPNRDAKKISGEDVICLARLASLRMWDAYVELNKMKDGR